MEAKRAKVAELESQHATVNEEHRRLQVELNNAEELLQTLLTGLSSSNKGQSGGGYMGQLAEARRKDAQGKAEEGQNRQKLSMAEKALAEAQAKWKTVEREAGEGRKKLQQMQKEVEDLRKKAAQTDWNADKEREGDEALRTARAEVRQLSEVSDVFALANICITDAEPPFSNATCLSSDYRSSTSAFPTRRRTLTDQR